GVVPFVRPGAGACACACRHCSDRGRLPTLQPGRRLVEWRGGPAHVHRRPCPMSATSHTSAAALLELFAVQVAALQGSLEGWSERAGLVEPGCVERVAGLAVKVGSGLLDALPYLRLRKVDVAAIGAALDALARSLALLERFAAAHRQNAHG